MTRLPSGDRHGGDSLGLWFSGGECIRSLLGFGSIVAEVGDGGVAAEVFRSMIAPPSGGLEAGTWLIPKPLATTKVVMPLGDLVY
jgi:hypothetical protein